MLKNRCFIRYSKNSLRNFAAEADRSKHVDYEQRYFTAIRDCWSDMTTCSSARTVDMIIAGSWNFKYFNVHYNNKKVIISGIQLENVTANVKQFGDTSKLIERNYSMNYFSLTINHSDKDIAVKVPTLNFVDLNSFNISSSQATPDIMKQFESTVTSFYRNSVYDNLAKDSNYRAKFLKFANEIMTKTILEDAPSAYDASSLFISNIVQKLKEKKHPFLDFEAEELYDTSISSNSDYISMATKRRVETQNVKIFVGDSPASSFTLTPIIQKEICITDHSQNTDSIVEHLIMNGTVSTSNSTARINVRVPFAVTSNRIMSVPGNYYNENERIYIDDQNMKDVYTQRSNFESSNTVMTTEIALMTSSFLRSRFKEFSYIPNFCQSTFNNSEHFIVISNTIDYPSQRFSTYHIKLYGLHNLNSLRMSYSITTTEFALTATNLTARVIWSYYLSDTVSRTPKIMDLQILNILLCGEIIDEKKLTFTDRSELRFSDQGNSMMMNKLKETTGTIVLSVIQQSILQKYNEIHKN